MFFLFRRIVLVAAAIVLAFLSNAAAEDEEVYYSDIPVKPMVTIQSPKPGDAVGKGSTLVVKALGQNTEKMEAIVSWEEEGEAGSISKSLSYEAEGTELETSFQLPQVTCAVTLIVRGFSSSSSPGGPMEAEREIQIPSPKEELINKMIALAYLNSKDSRYKFAPAQEDYDIGVCKNFVMRLFDTYSKDYRMLAYPDLEMHMPKNNKKVDCAPYDYGIEWKPETAAEGSPFEIVAQFKYNNDLTKEENALIARDMLEQVQRGDFFQMVGNYGGGNGPHSLLFIADYSPDGDTLRWTDSNMRGTRVNGVRWGYLQYDKDATAEWFINCINMKKRGATLYRLRDDLIRQ